MALTQRLRDLLRRDLVAAPVREENAGSEEVLPGAAAIAGLEAKIGEIEIKLKALSERHRVTSAQNEATIRQLRTELRSRRLLGSTILAHFIQPQAFACECERLEYEIRADTYICHDFEALLAADRLRSRGCLVVLDGVEIPSFRGRSMRVLRPLDPLAHALDRANAGLLSLADAAMAASPGIHRELAGAGLRAVYIPSYPAFRAPTDMAGIRQACGLGSTAKLVLVPGDIEPGLDLATIIAALKLLPEDYHLATAGDIYPESEKQRLIQFVHAQALRDRVHMLEAVECELYPAFARSADIGVMAQDPRIPAHRSMLPGSMFDCLCAGLPVAAADLPDMQEVLEGYGIGGRFERTSPASIAATVRGLVERRDDLTGNLGRAARDFIWGANEAKIVDLVGEGETVTILGISGIVSDIRTRNIADTLIRHRIGVTIVTTEALNGERRGGRPNHPVPGVKYVRAAV